MKQLIKGMVLALALCLGLMFNAPVLFAAGSSTGVNSDKTTTGQPAKKKTTKKTDKKADKKKKTKDTKQQTDKTKAAKPEADKAKSGKTATGKAKPDGASKKASGKKTEGKKQEPGKPAAKSKKGKDFTPPSKPININQATAAELEKLYGIGPVISKRIVDYRKKHGPFKSLDDLKQVKGIGPNLLQKNSKYMKLK